MKPEIVLALDVGSLKEAGHFVNLLYPQIKFFKVGSQLFTSCGPKAVNFIQHKGAEVFLDLKFFDIPHTVSEAVKQAARLKVKMLTLHILGGEKMIKEAVSACQEESKRLKIPRPLLIGVTVLTSQKTTPRQVLTLAKQGIKWGLDGVVCSVWEAEFLRKNIAKKFILVTPGIRPLGSFFHDQKRVATVLDAVKVGSNFLVVGRPILEAEKPLEVAEKMKGELDGRRN